LWPRPSGGKAGNHLLHLTAIKFLFSLLFVVAFAAGEQGRSASDMDSRLSAAGLIAVGAPDNSHDSTFGRINVPWFGALEIVDVIFEHETRDQPPTERQIDAFCRFASNRDPFFKSLEGKLFKYFNDARQESNLHQDMIERLFPHLDEPRQLKSLIELRSILVSYYDGEAWCDYIGLLMECSWEVEHGLGVKVVDGQVQEIGLQDIVL
jgi:hypothetical protein